MASLLELHDWLGIRPMLFILPLAATLDVDCKLTNRPLSIGASRIGVGAGGAAARPSVTGSVDDPLLEDRLPAQVSVEGPDVGMPAG
jgi:hypothetical protein